LIALIINAHQVERDGIDVEFVSLYQRLLLLAYRASRYLSAGTTTPAETNTDVKTRFSSRLTRQQAV